MNGGTNSEITEEEQHRLDREREVEVGSASVLHADGEDYSSAREACTVSGSSALKRKETSEPEAARVAKKRRSRSDDSSDDEEDDDQYDDDDNDDEEEDDDDEISSSMEEFIVGDDEDDESDEEYEEDGAVEESEEEDDDDEEGDADESLAEDENEDEDEVAETQKLTVKMLFAPKKATGNDAAANGSKPPLKRHQADDNEGVDPKNIIECGRRNRKAPERYRDKNYDRRMLKGVPEDEIDAVLISDDDEDAIEECDGSGEDDVSESEAEREGDEEGLDTSEEEAEREGEDVDDDEDDEVECVGSSTAPPKKHHQSISSLFGRSSSLPASTATLTASTSPTTPPSAVASVANTVSTTPPAISPETTTPQHPDSEQAVL